MASLVTNKFDLSSGWGLEILVRSQRRVAGNVVGGGGGGTGSQGQRLGSHSGGQGSALSRSSHRITYNYQKPAPTVGEAPKVEKGLKNYKTDLNKVSTGLKFIKQASTMGKAPKVSTGLKTLKQTSTMGKAPKVSTGLKKGRENLPHFKLAISVDGCPERPLVMVQSIPPEFRN